VSLLRERRAEGVEVRVVGRQVGSPLRPHGKLVLIDDTRAILGSMALSALSLDFRREVAVIIDNQAIVRELGSFFNDVSARGDVSLARLPGDRRA
jgi:phosphatidylserine/phosphatidylglycerophosphate/cardiolipin synthase-like enzyme